jgi:arylsulfatase A-like enzyme
LPESVNKFPVDWDDTVYRGESGYLPHPRPHAGYAAMISDLDGYVGRVMDALKKAGISERTLVVFTSDNGTTHSGPPNTHFHIGGADAKFFNSTADLRGYKGSVYEGGIRVPMIVRWPGHVKAGTVNETPSYFADWFPTFCEGFNLKQPEELDGNSLWKAITQGAAIEDRKPMIWVFPEYGGQVAVRLGDFKVVRQRLKTNRPGEWEVYNLAIDRSEAHNVADTQPEVIDQAIEILRREVSENARFPLSIPGVNTEKN